MTRADLVISMAAAGGWPKCTADRALRSLLAAIRASLKRGQPVTLVGFGTFTVSRRKPRRGKNPRTGQPMHVAGGRVPRFRPSRELKRAVRSGFSLGRPVGAR
jgi:DNA-binding protein HU-beta